MMPLRKCCLLFLFFLIAATSVLAQTAGFSADKQSGCSPLAISFTNTSTGFSPDATYQWDFGNTNSSTLKNPGTTYNNEGIYTVTLTVTDGSLTSSETMEIRVYKKPVVGFSVDVTKGCIPLGVTFVSHSLPGDGDISSYTWDFGDGVTLSASDSLLHTYNIPQIASPSLTVTNSFGCYSTLSQPQLVEVLATPAASFRANDTIFCDATANVSFINNSTGDNIVSYNWDFGDGTTSALRRPQHTYNQPGTYSVSLSVTAANGCVSDTVLEKYLNIDDFHTHFTVPALLCTQSQSTFTDSSTPAASEHIWLVNGAAAGAGLPILTYQFETPGNYDIQLINLYGSCPDTAAKTLTVLPAPATKGFVTDLQGTCGAPVTVLFRDTTQNATRWEWDFTGNGDFTSAGQTPSFTYTAEGNYPVTLRTTGINGCTAETTRRVSVHKTIVTIQSSGGDIGCETKTTIFSANSDDEVIEYDWNFGDNTPHSSDSVVQHTYTSPDDYTVTLQYVTKNGCRGTAKYEMHILEKPDFDFTAMPGTVICGNNPVTFVISGSNLAGSHFWNFGDPDVYSNPAAPFVHRYRNDSVYTVSLIIDNNGCRDTVTKVNYITVLPPFPDVVSATNTCEGTRGLVTFQDASAKADSYSWNFGDGSEPYNYTDTQSVVQHTYKASGAYLARITATKGDCAVSDSITVYVLLRQSPVLSAAISTFCSSDTLHALMSGMDNNPYSLLTDAPGYDLSAANYNNGSPFLGSMYFTDNQRQSPFPVNIQNLDVDQTQLRLITTSRYFNCTDTTNYLQFEALGPVAAFSVSNGNFCYNVPVVFNDESKTSHSSPIVKWKWDFGDSTITSANEGSAITHRYTAPGNYYPTLTITDANACTDSATLPTGFLAIKGPKADFSLPASPVLPQTDVSFYNLTNTTNTNFDDNAYTWNFGDGNIIRKQPFSDSVVHSYRHEGTDTVTLIVTNGVEKCSDTTFRVIVIKNPNLYFTYTTTYINPDSGCPPVIASFKNTSINTTRISWNFGDGGTADDLTNASHIYEKPGVYKVTLYGYFFDGSVDSTSEMITIKGPYAVLEANRMFACGAEPITLTATSSNTTQFTWDFGDGTLSNTADTFFTHRYLTPGVYTPALIVNDSNNCQFPFFLSEPIIIDTLHFTIKQNADVACASTQVYFTPEIVSEAKESLGLPLTYHWNFGSGRAGDTAATETASFYYSQPGTYEVTLSGTSPFGCTATARDTVKVQPTPIAAIGGPAQVCQDEPAQFTGTATRPVLWLWQFANGDTSTAQNPPLHVFSVPGTDTVSLVVNENGCYDTAWQVVQVNRNPVPAATAALTRICEGDSLLLEAHDGIVYNWVPARHIAQRTSATPTVYPDTSTTYYVEVTNEAGCSSIDSVVVAVVPRFRLTTVSPVYICLGGVAQLSAAGADQYRWLDTEVSNPNIANPTTALYGPKVYTVVGSDNFGCFTDTGRAQVITAVLPTIDAGENISTFAGNPVQVQATGSSDIAHWLWTPDQFINCDTCATITLTPRANIDYILQGTTREGCVNYDTLRVTIVCKQSQVTFPSAFTPNNDGRNDRFTFLGNGIRRIKHFAVFDRLGTMLYEKSNMDITDTYSGWDGTYQNKNMPPATYVFIADLECDTGETYRYKGTVVLIR